ncbi:MAG TPA: fibronectin type III domain-containing protein, partial [Candidatus Binatus sp.]|nr:fibronectin type III domain-containing protein [Candidatus Binatus sp.]
MVSRRSYVYAGKNGRLSEDTTRFGAWDSFEGISTSSDKQLKLCYFYNQQGLLSQMRYPADANCTENSAPDGVALLNYTYRNGALNKIQDAKRSADLVKSVSYNAPGGLRELVLGNGKATSIAPDIMSRPDAISVLDPDNRGAAALFKTGHYTFDGSGNILSIGPSDANTIDSFEYDSLSRLKSAEVYFQDPNTHVYHETYDYDDFGNMFEKTKALDSGSGGTTMTTSQASNRLDALANVPTAYDPKGNYLGTYQVDPNSSVLKAVNAYLFDSRNRMLAAGEAAKTFPVGQYAYDAGGLRIMKQFPGSGERTFYLRDAGGNVLTEFTLPPVKDDEFYQKDYFYALGQVIGMAQEKSPAPVQGFWGTMSFYPGDEEDPATMAVHLHWNLNSESGITGYKVWRKKGSGGWGSYDVGASATTYNAVQGFGSGGLASGETYYYRIAAVNSYGEGIPSRTLKFVMAENSTPAAPTSPTLEKHDRSLTIRWQRSTDDTGYVTSSSDPQSMFQGYQVYRQDTPSGSWSKRNLL